MGWVVDATPRPLYRRERPGTHCIGGWLGPRAGLNGCGKSRHHRDSILGPSNPWRVAIRTELYRPSIIDVNIPCWLLSSVLCVCVCVRARFYAVCIAFILCCSFIWPLHCLSGTLLKGRLYRTKYTKQFVLYLGVVRSFWSGTRTVLTCFTWFSQVPAGKCCDTTLQYIKGTHIISGLWLTDHAHWSFKCSTLHK